MKRCRRILLSGDHLGRGLHIQSAPENLTVFEI